MATDASPTNKSQGRKKIEIKLIKKKSSRMVTFSKRRASLFRKASELATICGAHVAVMIFSPGGKIYSFGHPSVGAVVERYESSARHIKASQPNNLYGAEFMRMAEYKAEKTLRLKMELQRTLDEIDAKKSKIQMLDMVWEKEHATRYWWNAPVEEMNQAKCNALEKKLMDLRINVEAEVKRRNQSEDSKKDLITQATPGKVVAPASVGDLAPNNSASVFPSNFLAGWIYSAARSSNAASASPVTNFQGIGFYNFGGGTSNSASLPRSSSSSVGTRIGHGRGPNSNGVGPNHTNFHNFPF